MALSMQRLQAVMVGVLLFRAPTPASEASSAKQNKLERAIASTETHFEVLETEETVDYVHSQAEAGWQEELTGTKAEESGEEEGWGAYPPIFRGLHQRRLALGRNLLENPKFEHGIKQSAWKTYTHKSMGRRPSFSIHSGRVRVHISNMSPGKAPWHIQLYQSKQLTEGFKYRLSVDIKVAEGPRTRKVNLVLQQDGEERKVFATYSCTANAESWTRCYVDGVISDASEMIRVGIKGGGDKIDFDLYNAKLQEIVSSSPAPTPVVALAQSPVATDGMEGLIETRLRGGNTGRRNHRGVPIL